MQDKNTSQENAPGSKREPSNTETITEAHKQAEKDIAKDPDFKPDPQNDLDEGELARFEGEE